METQQTRTPKSADCTPPWLPSLQHCYLLGLGAQKRREAEGVLQEIDNARMPHCDGPWSHGELETSHRDSIHTTEMSKSYKPGLPTSPDPRPLLPRRTIIAPV